MSATTESLLLQIFELEALIQEKTLKGHDTTDLKENLLILHQKLHFLNESLGNSKNVLKG